MTWFNLVSSPDLKRVTMKVWMGKGLINRLRKKYLVLTFHQHVNRSFLPSNLIIIRREGNSRCNHETVLIRDAAKSLTRKRVSWTLKSAIQRWRENVKSFRSGASPILINIKVSRPPRFIHLFPFFLFSLFLSFLSLYSFAAFLCLSSPILVEQPWNFLIASSAVQIRWKTFVSQRNSWRDE